MNKQAAKNTALIVGAFTMAGLGFAGMMTLAPMFTMIFLGLLASGFMIRAIYNIERGRIECEESQARLKDLR